jgi:plasmid stability protein
MPSIRINDLPTETHAVLRRRAAEANQSLQEYLRSLLIEEASRPTVDEVFRRVAGRSGGVIPIELVTEIVRGDRDRA